MPRDMLCQWDTAWGRGQSKLQHFSVWPKISKLNHSQSPAGRCGYISCLWTGRQICHYGRGHGDRNAASEGAFEIRQWHCSALKLAPGTVSGDMHVAVTGWGGQGSSCSLATIILAAFTTFDSLCVTYGLSLDSIFSPGRKKQKQWWSWQSVIVSVQRLMPPGAAIWCPLSHLGQCHFTNKGLEAAIPSLTL